jgi:IMP dehydrogenase
MRLRKALSFDDVLLVPQYSTVHSRADVDLSTTIAGVPLKIPIIAANMSSVCEVEMAKAMADLGGMGVIHRFCSVKEQAEMVRQSAVDGRTVGFAIGIGDDWIERMEACQRNATVAVLDVAHGAHCRVITLLEQYFDIYKDFPIVIGQVSTPSAVRYLLQGVPEQYHRTVAFKTSIGGGSLCTTRLQTGFGTPTLQAIIDIATDFPDLSLVGDGGIKHSGDVVKSLAAGANAVMLGHLLSGTDEAPGRLIKCRDGYNYKEYMGSASLAAKRIRGELHHIEGDSTLVRCKGPVHTVISALLDGIKSGFSYGGAHNVDTFQEDVEFIQISTAGHHESMPHGLF